MIGDLGTYKGFDLSVERAGQMLRGYARLPRPGTDEISLGLSVAAEDLVDVTRRLRELVDLWRDEHGDDWEQGLMDE